MRAGLDLLQFSVDEARVAHHQPAVGESFQEARKHLGETGLVSEVISAGKGGIGKNAELVGLAPETDAQEIEQQILAVLQPHRAARPPALSDPSLRHSLGAHLEYRIAHLWEEMHMLGN